MKLLFCDLETYSNTPIKSGAYKYAEDDFAHILLWGYAIDDQPAKVWEVQRENQSPFGGMPEDLHRAWQEVRNGQRTVVWHNGINFDLTFIDHAAKIYSLPKGIANVRDTMVMAYQHGLPGALGDLSKVYKLGEDKAKDRDGARLIRLFCVPRPEGRVFNWDTHPEDWARFVNYCRLDVEAEREIYKKLPKINCSARELEYQRVDYEINKRGMLIDVELARKAVKLSETAAEVSKQRTAVLTDGALDSTTRTAATMAYLKDTYGIGLDNLTKGEVERLIEADIPEPAKELLRIRLSSAKASVKKFQALLDSTCKDGRLRGCLQFRGAARTGRFAGRIFQPQNLPRPSMSDEEIEAAIDAVKGGYADLLYSDINQVLPNLLRGEIIAPEGKKLVVADYSNIEGRVLAWEAGETWKLDAFRDFDRGTGHDLYKLTYSKAFAVPVDTVTKAQRQMGKVLELAMGYGGGAGAFVTFARGYGIDLEQMAKQVLPVVPADVAEEAARAYEWAAKTPARLCGLTRDVWVACDSVKRLWRRANRQIVSFWDQVDKACVMALTEGLSISLRMPASECKLRFGMNAGWLMITLPSGRTLCYPQARIGTEEEACTFTYMGVGQVSHKWERIRTYSGKVVENLTQAIACDILCEALLRLDGSGFDAVLTIHDEIITEAPNTPEFSAQRLEEIMSSHCPWAKDLPLVAAGFESQRYHK